MANDDYTPLDFESWEIRLFQLYPGLKEVNYEASERALLGLFVSMGYSHEHASEAASVAVKEAQAWQFFEEHPLAPRRWATHIEKGEKNF